MTSPRSAPPNRAYTFGSLKSSNPTLSRSFGSRPHDAGHSRIIGDVQYVVTDDGEWVKQPSLNRPFKQLLNDAYFPTLEQVGASTGAAVLYLDDEKANGRTIGKISIDLTPVQQRVLPMIKTLIINYDKASSRILQITGTTPDKEPLDVTFSGTDDAKSSVTAPPTIEATPTAPRP